MQTITRIEEDMYIMKNYEFLFRAGYFAVYFMINLLNMFSMIFSNTSYKYGYVILIFSSLLLFLLKKYVFKKLLFIFKKDKLEIQEIWSNKLIKKIILNYEDILDFKITEISARDGTSYYIKIITPTVEKSYYYDLFKEDAYKVVEIYNLYIEHSSFPRLVHVEDDESIDEYLESILNTVILKDIVTRLKITDVPLLLDIIKYLLANIGSLINPTKIANTLTSYGRKTDNKTVEKYLQGLKDGLLIYEVERFDVKGKTLLQRNSKYYVVDSAFRKFLLSRTDSDRGHILENIVYLELVRRGYRVYVGHLQNGEIDFVAKKPHRLEYYQVSYSVMEDTTLRRELSPLEQLDDNYPKYLLTMDVLHKTDNHNGIEQKNVLDWLLE